MKYYYQANHLKNTLKILILFLIFLGYASNDACAYLKENNESQLSKEVSLDEEILSDPFETLNRTVFQLNQRLDNYIIHPVAQGYTILLPQLVREGIHQFIMNLRSPIIFLNDILQGEGDQAMETLGRFVINSTIGLTGFFDPASHYFDLSFHDNEFGITLGSYGIQSGPYLVLPVIGPSNPRDTLGLIVNFLSDPFYYIVAHNDARYLSFVRIGVETVDKRVDNDDILENIKHASDSYIRMKTLYQQNREFNVKKGIVNSESATPND